MYSKLLFLFFLNFFSIINLASNIITINSIQDLIHHVDNETIVFVDIDETLINTVDLLTEWKSFPVEPITANIIKTIQDQLIPVIGITKRRIKENDKAQATVKDLAECEINLARTAIQAPITMNLPHGVFYNEGIFFCGTYPKGGIIDRFLQALEQKPKKIVLLDDIYANLETAQQAAQLNGITKFVGLHYVEKRQNQNVSSVCIIN